MGTMEGIRVDLWVSRKAFEWLDWWVPQHESDWTDENPEKKKIGRSVGKDFHLGLLGHELVRQ